MGKYVLCFRAPLNVNGNSGGPLTPWERMWPECNFHNKHIFSSSQFISFHQCTVMSTSDTMWSYFYMCHNGLLVFYRYLMVLMNCFSSECLCTLWAFSCPKFRWTFTAAILLNFLYSHQVRVRVVCNHPWLAVRPWQKCQPALSLCVYTADPEAHFGKMASNDLPHPLSTVITLFTHTQAFRGES